MIKAFRQLIGSRCKHYTMRKPIWASSMIYSFQDLSCHHDKIEVFGKSIKSKLKKDVPEEHAGDVCLSMPAYACMPTSRP